jgi:hypothetical protein
MGSVTQFTTDGIDEVMGIFYATEDVTLSFDVSTPIADIDAGDVFIPANTHMQLVFPSQYISAIGSVAGKLHINIIDLWDSLATELQQDNV